MASSSLVTKFGRRLRQGDTKNAVYLTYYYSYLKYRDWRSGTKFASSSTPSAHGSSAENATGNFPAHPRIAARILQQVPDRQSKTLVDVGCGSGMVCRVAVEQGFGHVEGIELFEDVAAIAQSNLKGTPAVVRVEDALSADLTHADVLFLFRPFVDLDLYSVLIQRSNPQWLVLINLNDVKPEGYVVKYSYSHPIYTNFTSRLLERI